MDTSHSNEKIAEALKLLEEAAKDKKDELRRTITDKYSHLSSVLEETGSSLAESLSGAEKRAVQAVLHAKEVAQEKIKKAGTAVDEHVHENPWPYIGGAALGAFLFGYILGKKK